MVYVVCNDFNFTVNDDCLLKLNTSVSIFLFHTFTNIITIQTNTFKIYHFHEFLLKLI